MFHSYEPRAGHGLRHDPLNSIVAPRPIGWISTLDAEDRRNLAPYSFFNLFNYRPPIVGFSSTEWKDSAANAIGRGEFVWNLATRALAERMNATSKAVAPGVDEFELAGIEATPSDLVAPPRVAASPVAFECRVTQSFPLVDVQGIQTGAWMVLGEAVKIHIDESCLRDGVFDTLAADPVLRAGGPVAYFGISEATRFEMRRPDPQTR